MRKICFGLISFLFISFFSFGNFYVSNITKPAAAQSLFSQCFQSTQNTTIPLCVYRADHRTPDKIFAEGFQLPGNGTNNNILDHMTGASLIGSSQIPSRNTTNFISTTESEEFAANWSKSYTQHKWVYAIEPDENFFSSHISLETAIKNNNLSKDIREKAEKTLNYYGNQLEWFGQGGIVKERIISAIPYLVDKDTGKPTPQPEHKRENPNYQAASTKPTANPLPITEVTQCLSSAFVKRELAATNNACSWVAPKNEAELKEVHFENIQEQLGNGLEDLNFVTNPEFVANMDKRLMSPLRKSNQIVNNFHPNTGVDGWVCTGFS